MNYTPICFSRQFTNKQNLRSFKNTINFKIFKSADAFLQHILEEQFLIKEISLEFKEIVDNLRKNIETHSKNHFQFYFSRLIEFNNFKPVDKSQIFLACWTVLLKMVPSLFCGNNHNNKIFKKCIKTIVYSINHQHFNLCEMITGWELSVFPWNTLSAHVSFKVLYLSLLWILKKLLSSIIVLNFHVTTCKIDTDENKLYFFWKNQWQSFYDKKISDLIISKVINKFEPYSLGKHLKRKYSLQERLRIKSIIRTIPKLHIVLKLNNEYRPIVRYKNVENTTERHITKERLRFLRKLAGKPHEKIENLFLFFINKWIARKKPKLYFVKSDLSNAFGSINRLKLFYLLSEKYAKLQKEETSLLVKKKYKQNYKDLITELRKPLLIRAGSTIYEWKQGLVQGYKYSPALSELYYSYMDEVYFSHHLQTTDDELKLFTRVVDDYLYITDSLEAAHCFINSLSSYRNVNYNKTVVNFPFDTIKFSPDIVFLGYSYNTISMEVSRANTALCGQMCFKIGFSMAIADLDKFLENRIGQSGIEINSHIFNFFYNSEQMVWNHVFLTLCLAANKFCTILAILCNDKDICKYLPLYKKRVTVKLCNTIIDTLLKNKPSNFMFIYCTNHFRYLSFKALILCAQKTPTCNKLIPYITIELKKTNCLIGKWREHSSIICKSGYSVKPAIKEVCRRSDLKSIFKNFEVFPNYFCCFNKKSLQG